MPSELSEPEVRSSKQTFDSVSQASEPGSGWGGVVRKLVVVLVILLVVGAAIWKIRRNTAEQKAQNAQLEAQGDRPTPVLTSTVEQKPMPVYLTALGTVTAYNTVTIKTRVDGQLMRVNVNEGQAVKQGQLLMEIDPKPYEAALAQAKGQLVKDQANAKNALAEAQRYTALAKAGVVSQESEQTQISASGQAAGSIEADMAAIDAAKVNLAYTKIASPINGVVGLRQVDPGNIVHATDTTGLLVVTQLQPISVIFTLPEDQLPEVFRLTRGGAKLRVEAYDRSSSTHLATGELLTLDNQIDTTTGTDKVKAVFNNSDGALFPNQFVNVRLVLHDRNDAVVIPAAALQTGTQGSFVYLVKQGATPANLRQTGPDGTPAAADPSGSYVVTQPVKIDVAEGSQLIVGSGLKPGDQIVVDGQERLRNGSSVIPKLTQVAPQGQGRRS
ncbi:efflux RND transporter periplasmic adaptor subunit [Granulicella arctica]|uniref:Multidrug efflux system membrane fusion protein n=1 Tax=Granulicella arctica TaxID=940613 RepID=A0A7Y9PG41_9BACT|nr:efflux RND transporter periplasmic adaptor subunit [Granulicella arctica]NYF79079.1 multidrug efflux system membrane fusion protein [Granulicella arctica]